MSAIGSGRFQKVMLAPIIRSTRKRDAAIGILCPSFVFVAGQIFLNWRIFLADDILTVLGGSLFVIVLVPVGPFIVSFSDPDIAIYTGSLVLNFVLVLAYFEPPWRTFAALAIGTAWTYCGVNSGILIA